MDTDNVVCVCVKISCQDKERSLAICDNMDGRITLSKISQRETDTIWSQHIESNEKHTIKKKKLLLTEKRQRQADGGKVARMKGVERYSVSVTK